MRCPGAMLEAMNAETDLAWIASLLGDPARSRILLALMDGRARTAKELAFLARIAAPTASAHLGKLLGSSLVAVEPQRRHRYFRLASAEVGQLIKALAIVAGEATPSTAWRSRANESLAAARTCYDHLAGRLGVAIADALQARGDLVLAGGGGALTLSGRAFMGSLGIDLDRFGATRRVLCRPCLDRTERRFHLAGSVGAAICAHCLEQGWVWRMRDSRALIVSAEGRERFAAVFGIDGRDLEVPGRRVAA
jgi:DNA-binding transcriptional ArsR family regulator